MARRASHKRSRSKPAAVRKRLVAAKRRLRAPDASDEASARPARSAAMRLAAEVERLEQQLVAARRQMAVLAARADIDPLTDMLNRRGFERELKRSLAYVKRYATSAALIYVDLDGFKRINDRHGHAAGDKMLEAVAMVLSRHVRASDLLARLGGDEFVLLLWNCSEADAQAKAIALEAAIAQTTAIHAGATLSVGASAGAAPVLPLDQVADVLERADRAMYARKAVRRGQAAAG